LLQQAKESLQRGDWLKLVDSCHPFKSNTAERLMKIARIAVPMVTTLYAALGVKASNDVEGMLKGALDMFQTDELGYASGLWEPINITPLTLALACQKLINTAISLPSLLNCAQPAARHARMSGRLNKPWKGW